MNRLILLGNGFDLSHDLKTSFKDFILDFLKKELIKATREPINNPLFEIETILYTTFRDPLKTFVQYQKNKVIKCPEYSFFGKCISNIEKYGWVDIEELYFETLKEIPPKYIDKEPISQMVEIVNNQ
jgi:hypothetical protein